MITPSPDPVQEHPSLRTKVHAWLVLSRPPFHLVGVLPFILGGALAWSRGYMFHWDIFATGAAGVVLIMLSTYWAGEYWDIAEDSLSMQHGSSRFAGGSGVIQRGLLTRSHAIYGAVFCLLLALAVVFLLQFGYATGPLTIPFGLAGMTGGFLYSARPVRWVSRGVGEIWIAFCYGWLPVAAGFYIQAGSLAPEIHLMALPIALTIFNVILLNEYPDYQADLQAGKKNLLVRLERSRAARLYGVIAAGSWGAVAFSVCRGISPITFWAYLPVLLLSVILVVMVLRRPWEDREMLERLCAANIVVNIGTTTAYLIGLAA